MSITTTVAAILDADSEMASKNPGAVAAPGFPARHLFGRKPWHVRPKMIAGSNADISMLSDENGKY